MSKIIDERINTVEKVMHVPLVGLQRSLYYMTKSVDSMSAYNIPAIVTLKGVVDKEILIGSVNALLDKHKILSAQITEKDHEPYQFYSKTNKLKMLMRSDLDAGLLGQAILEEAKRSFVLLEQPLARVVLWEVDQCKYILQFTISHIICDRHSLSIIVDDLMYMYRQIQQNHVASQVSFEHPLLFFDYASKKSSANHVKKHQENLEYWLNKLRNFEVYEYIPNDYLKNKEINYEGAIERRQFINSGLIKNFCAESKVRPYVFFAAALKVLLNIYSSIDDIIIGTPVTTRPAEFSSAVGLFVNTLLLRSRISSDQGFNSILKEVGKNIDEAMRHPEMLISDALKHAGFKNKSHRELFQCMLVYQNYDFETYAESGFTASVSLVDNSTAKFDFSLFVFDAIDTFKLKVEYNKRVFKSTTVKFVLNHFTNLLNCLINFPEQPICKAQIADKNEIGQLLFRFGHGDEVSVPSKLVTQQLDGIASDALKSQAVAVTYENQVLTYKELASCADRVAHFLQQKGLSAGDVVGLHLEESLAIMPAIFGVLKAGCVYLPLYPGYPKERLLAIVNDAKPSCIISSDDELYNAPNNMSVYLVKQMLATPCEKTVTCTVSTESPAYIIYTSGSTGVPKGVIVSHRAMLNRIHWMRDFYGISQDDCILHKTSIMFDVSIWELFLPVVSGATMVVSHPGGNKDPLYLLSLIHSNHVTAMHFVPTMLEAFLELNNLNYTGSLKHVFCSGDALKSSIVMKFYNKMPQGIKLYNLYGPTEAAAT